MDRAPLRGLHQAGAARPLPHSFHRSDRGRHHHGSKLGQQRRGSRPRFRPESHGEPAVQEGISAGNGRATAEAARGRRRRGSFRQAGRLSRRGRRRSLDPDPRQQATWHDRKRRDARNRRPVFYVHVRELRHWRFEPHGLFHGRRRGGNARQGPSQPPVYLREERPGKDAPATCHPELRERNDAAAQHHLRRFGRTALRLHGGKRRTRQGEVELQELQDPL